MIILCVEFVNLFDKCKFVFENDFYGWKQKDFGRLSIPAIVCEPLSFLQRIGESAQYAGLLSRAALCNDPCQRMELVAAFVFSALACIERFAVPFDSVLGETYELVRYPIV